MTEEGYVKTWLLTPDNIPEFCQKSGQDENMMMAGYYTAKSQGKDLIGYLASDNPPYNTKENENG